MLDMFTCYSGSRGSRCRRADARENGWGHLWYLSPQGDGPRSVAILRHSRWSSILLNPEFVSYFNRIVYLDVKMRKGRVFIIVSTHLPHSGYSDIIFDAALAVLEQIVLEARRAKNFCVFEVDANVVLGSRSEHDKCGIIGP